MAAVRWGDGGYGGCIEVFDGFGNSELIYKNDPRFAKLLAVLEWIPTSDEILSNNKPIIKWWDDIPIETISHLVKKT